MKSGFVGVLGQTNVGKSTLINAILEKKILIVSEKIQTTRNRIRCIYNDPEAQIIFVDTPGLHKPVNRLSRYLLHQAYGALQGLDLILYMVEPWVEVQDYDEKIFARWRDLKLPAILLVNKIDRAKGEEMPQTLKNYGELGLFTELVPISCKEGINLGLVLQLVKKNLPEGPSYFPRPVPASSSRVDELTDRSEEFLIAEFVREQVFRLTFQEVPYSAAVEVVELHEREDNLIEIYADIYVARESQKGIIIGKGGRMIREIGSRAREEIERLLGAHVFLDLRVKVRKDWVESEGQIARLVEGD